MRVIKFVELALVGVFLVGLIGCASCGKSTCGKNGLKGLGIGDTYSFYGEELTADQERDLLAKDKIYFDFDCFDITPEYKLIVYAHAKKLLEHPNLKIRIDGHTDERGSREYNIGLSERRAKAVAKVLALKGVAEDRIITVSYGKEKPVAFGHYEGAWSLNRRAEINYEN